MDRETRPISSPAQTPSIGASCAFPAIPPPVGVGLTVLSEHPCSYFPERTARMRALWCDEIDGQIYHKFMDAGFRRSGKLIYQPVCTGCRACIPIRLSVEDFRPDKSQRRCMRKNADLAVSVGKPQATDEKLTLYRKYVTAWHAGEAGTVSNFEQFLYDSPATTIEFCHRNADGMLLAVGLCDVCAESLSSVYFYFDPGECRRGLGTFGALWEIQFARQMRIPFYYLGYWIDGCRTMQYKSSFRPYELLHPDGIWRREDSP